MLCLAMELLHMDAPSSVQPVPEISLVYTTTTLYLLSTAELYSTTTALTRAPMDYFALPISGRSRKAASISC